MPKKEIDRRQPPDPAAAVRRARQSGRSRARRPDWNQASHVQPPEGAPNVLLVLIDDAGFRQSEHVRRSDPDPELHSAGGERACATTAFT